MAQKRFFNYKAPLISFDENIHEAARVGNGRYHGFDTPEWLSGLSCQITHENSGFSYLDANLVTSSSTGVFITGQGVVVFEDEKTPQLTIQSNANNGKIRYDILVAEHKYKGVDGGEDATYKIIKGQINNEVIPSYNPYTQTLLGIFKIQPNALDNTLIEYRKAKTPDVGDGSTARLNIVNYFKAMIQQNKYENKIVDANLVNYSNLSFLELPNNANVFELNISIGEEATKSIAGIKIDEGMQEGTEIKLYCKGNFSILDNLQQLNNVDFTQTEPYFKGFRKIQLPSTVRNSGNAFDLLDATGPCIITLTFVDDQWNATAFELRQGKFSGVFKGVKKITQSTVLTLNDANFWLQLEMSGGTITLPNIDQITDSTIIGFDAQSVGNLIGAGAVKVKTDSSDVSVLLLNTNLDGSPSNEVYLHKMERLWFMKQGNFWFAVNIFGNQLCVGDIVYSHVGDKRFGQLPLDGRLVKRSEYPRLWDYANKLPSELLMEDDLWNVVLTANTNCGRFSKGDGTTTFRLPDLGGAFIRNMWNKENQDVIRQGDNIGVGTSQKDDIKPHDHFITSDIAKTNYKSDEDYLVRRVRDGDNSDNYTLGSEADEPTKFKTSKYQGYETRPVNVSLIPCIKF